MSDDLIKRSDARRVAKRIAQIIEPTLFDETIRLIIEKHIDTIPSVDRPQGEWVDISEWYAPRQKCSICETIVVGYGSNYCPNCGCRMKGIENDM